MDEIINELIKNSPPSFKSLESNIDQPAKRID
jgi:hypothetical protein